MQELPTPTSETEAPEMLRALAECYDIPEENLERAAMCIGVRLLYESEVLLAQIPREDLPETRKGGRRAGA
jgi:hypothetical protein